MPETRSGQRARTNRSKFAVSRSVFFSPPSQPHNPLPARDRQVAVIRMESAQKPSTEKKKQSRSRNGRQLGLGIVLALSLALPTARGGQDVTVAWDPSTTPGVDRYVLHFGTNSGAYFDFVAS